MKKWLQSVFLIGFITFFCFLVSGTPQPIKPNLQAQLECSAIVEIPSKFFSLDADFGSGILINNNDNPYLMTNAHIGMVVEGSPYPIRIVKKKFVDNFVVETYAPVVCDFKNLDVALIQLQPGIPIKPEHPISFCTNFSKERLSIGDEVNYFGLPGFQCVPFLYNGKISHTAVHMNPMFGKKYRGGGINTQAIGGNSGSGIFNGKGECIGILTSTIPNGNQTVFVTATSIREEFKKAGLEDLLNGTFTGNLKKEYQGIAKCH